MSVTKRMRILKTVEIGEIGEKDAKRIHILKTVELADFAEKNPKRMGILKVREFECSAPLSELKPLQCTVLFLCKMQIPIEKNLILFSNVLRTFSFTKQGSLRSLGSLPASGAEGFRGLGSLPFSEEPKRIRQKSLGSLPKTE